MKVCQLSKFYPPFLGGIEKVASDLTDAYKYLGYESCVLCAHHDVMLPSSTEHTDKTKIIRAMSFGKLLSMSVSFSYILETIKLRNKYDIFHIHLPNPLANLALSFIPKHKKVVLHWHSDIIKQSLFMKIYAPFQTLMLKRADKILVTSEAYASSSNCLRHYTHKVETLPIGIDKSDIIDDVEYAAEVRNRYPKKKIIFSLGRLTYYKGFKFLIESALHLSDDYVILIGGVGELDCELRTLIKDYELDSKVKMLGMIPANKLGAYYRACDVFALPSVEKSEAFGVVQIEAMSFEKPVLSTNIVGSGVPWVNENDVSGFVVPPKNPTAIADGIVRMFNNDNYNRLSRGAYLRYKSVFHKRIMYKNLMNIYESL